ncbi:YtxH domain-containing protein [Pseudodesulfovibrio senegalensis]|jgi:ElaB/YqjD/DUF883 family membrane-anchored ribosome-binding protein|uniref:YtxH domain-containing protein n=1 Tax=Pseudodesulfovibrio senegalensis TaxID=1721087 RepID=A0A6N6MY27_9BACT|nr:YtxH domain-containing protein [Pseudodesulfovibrio senegalensis]KAB1439114.1 YtxH domain-containing protein [Pseudodesulfovibrio senegalensis]
MKKYVILACTLFLLFGATACSDEHAAEKAGKKIDQTVQQAKDGGKSALDKFNEDANESFKNVKEKVNEAADDVGEGLKEAKDVVVDKVKDMSK